MSIPNQLETGHSTQNLLASPIIHPRVQRICGEEGAARRGEKRALFSIFHSNSMIQRNLVFIKKKGKQSFKSLFSVDDEPPTMTMWTAVFSSQLSHSMTTLLFARPVFIASVLQIPKLKTRK